MTKKAPTYTKDELLDRVKKANKAYTQGELVPASVVLAELRKRHEAISA